METPHDRMIRLSAYATIGGGAALLFNILLVYHPNTTYQVEITAAGLVVLGTALILALLAWMSRPPAPPGEPPKPA